MPLIDGSQEAARQFHSCQPLVAIFTDVTNAEQICNWQLRSDGA